MSRFGQNTDTDSIKAQYSQGTIHTAVQLGLKTNKNIMLLSVTAAD